MVVIEKFYLKLFISSFPPKKKKKKNKQTKKKKKRKKERKKKKTLMSLVYGESRMLYPFSVSVSVCYDARQT